MRESGNALVVLYKEQAQYEKAEPLLLEVVEGRIFKLSDTHPHTIASLNNLNDPYEAWGKPEKAHERRAKLPQTEAVKERDQGRKVAFLSSRRTSRRHGDILTPKCL